MGLALSTAVSGLRAHNQLIDVVGNNLANLSTNGFKTKRILFSDLIYRDSISTAQSATATSGGTNPGQIGAGVQSTIVDANLSQGSLEATGSLFDFAIEGQGYFTMFDGNLNRPVYSRVGAFSLDDTGTLVDPATGYRVQRFGVAGEPVGTAPGFQTPGDSSIKVAFGATIPGNETTSVSIGGNLPANASAPVSQVLNSLNPFLSGGVPATPATLLTSLDSSVGSYVGGDSLVLAGTDFDGSAVSSTLAVDGATTIADVVTAVNSLFSGASATVDANGRLIVTADQSGMTGLALSITDSLANTGFTDWASHAPVVQIAGQDGATVENSLEVYDQQGAAHALGVTFQKVGINEWNMTVAIDSSEGTLLDNLVEGIVFNDDGSILESGGVGLGDTDIEVQFSNFSTPQVIQFDFGVGGLRDGLSHLAVEGSITVDQDGFGSGTLTDVSISSTGLLQAESSNGRKFELAQLAIARFRNPKGLREVGGNYSVESPSSGEVQIGPGQNGGRGVVRGGHLESSNVDMALQFTKLIVAQRGFSANARTITVADQLLQELTNLIR